jgi:predicted nucleotidyltransferase
MPDIQKMNLPKDKLKALNIAVVYLFGSYAEGIAGKASDIDIGVVFPNSEGIVKNSGEIYQQLYDIFTDVFNVSESKIIDIVFMNRVGLELRFDIISHGKVLYESSSNFRMEYEERISALYRDFKPIQNEMDRTILSRV